MAREFWLQPSTWTNYPTDQNFGSTEEPDLEIHVIEYQAVVELKEKLKIAEIALETLSTYVPNTDLAFVSDQMKIFAREALLKIKEE